MDEKYQSKETVRPCAARANNGPSGDLFVKAPVRAEFYFLKGALFSPISSFPAKRQTPFFQAASRR